MLLKRENRTRDPDAARRTGETQTKLVNRTPFTGGGGGGVVGANLHRAAVSTEAAGGDEGAPTLDVSVCTINRCRQSCVLTRLRVYV